MEFQKPTDEDIRQVRAEHQGTRLRMLSAYGATFIVRPPTEAEFARMQMTVESGGTTKKLIAATQLLRDVAVWPSRETAAEILKELPGLGLNLVDDIIDLIGVGGAVEKKDL